MTGTDPFNDKANELAHVFHFENRYESKMFQSIMPNTDAMGISNAGQNQVKSAI